MGKRKVIPPAVWANEYHEGNEAGPEYYTVAPISLDDFLKKIEVFKGVRRNNVFIYANNAGVAVVRQTARERAKAARATARNVQYHVSIMMLDVVYDALRGLAFRRRTDLGPIIQELVRDELRRMGKRKLTLSPEELRMKTDSETEIRSDILTNKQNRSFFLARPQFSRISDMQFVQKLSKGLIVNILLRRALLRQGDALLPEQQKKLTSIAI